MMFNMYLTKDITKEKAEEFQYIFKDQVSIIRKNKTDLALVYLKLNDIIDSYDWKMYLRNKIYNQEKLLRVEEVKTSKKKINYDNRVVQQFWCVDNTQCVIKFLFEKEQNVNVYKSDVFVKYWDVIIECERTNTVAELVNFELFGKKKTK